MGNKDATVTGALHGTKDPCSGGGTLESDVEEALERPRAVLDRLGELERAVRLGLTLVLVREAELGERATGAEESGGIRGGPVGETVVNAVARELVRVGRGEDKVALELGVDDL